jgi:cell shape-determining protein MreC
LKAEFGRSDHIKGVLARVVVPPNRSIYDTIIIDAGVDEGITIGQNVFAFGSIAIGTISDVSTNSSTVSLFSASGRQTAGTTTGSDIAVTLIGRGAGEYEVRMPRDIVFEQGGGISTQSLGVHTIATIQKIVTDPRDPFQRLLAKAPVNLQTMKWVIVK